MSRREGFALVLLLPVYLWSAWPTRLGVVDDAYVSARYARLWVEGCGLRFNCGEPPVEGFTNFLWVVALTPGVALGVHVAAWVTSLGLAFGVGAIGATWWLARVEGARPMAAVGAAAVLAALPAFGVASTNGLETSLFCAAVLGAAATSRRGGTCAGLLAGALYLIRPEGVVVGAILAARSRSARTLGVWAAVVGLYFAGRWAWFGTLVPNTWSAQARDGLGAMLVMNADYLRAGAPTLVGLGLLGILAAFGRSRLLLGLAAGLVLLALQVYNWMPGLRLFLAPAALILAAAAPVVGRRPWLALPVLAWLGWLQVGPRAQEVRYDLQNTALPGNGAERLGEEIARLAPPGTWLLIRDAGVTAYYAGPGVRVLDMHPFSLTDPALTGQRWSVDHLLDRDVGFVVTTGHSPEETSQYTAETRLLRDPRLADFVAAGAWNQHARRWYTLFVRKDLNPAVP